MARTTVVVRPINTLTSTAAASLSQLRRARKTASRWTRRVCFGVGKAVVSYPADQPWFFWEKIRGWAARDFLPRSRRRCGMVEVKVNQRAPRLGDTLLPSWNHCLEGRTLGALTPGRKHRRSRRAADGLCGPLKRRERSLAGSLGNWIPRRLVGTSSPKLLI
jgi:hypothetical protein